MLRMAILLFVLGLLAFLLSAFNVAALPLEVGKLLLIIFLVFSLLTFIVGVTTPRSFNDKLGK
jgi:hypothetical protein